MKIKKGNKEVLLEKEKRVLKVLKREKEEPKKTGKLEKMKLFIVATALVSTLLAGCATKTQSFSEYAADNGMKLTASEQFKDFYFVDSVTPNGNNEDTLDLFANHIYAQRMNVSEFGELLGYSNITWDDIKEVIKNNQNIDSSHAEILIDAVSKLQRDGLKMDLSVLYYNLNNLKISVVDPQEICELGGLRVAGSFEAYENTCYLANDITEEKAKRTLIHEVIGHGSNYAYDPNTNTLCTLTNNYFYSSDGQSFLLDTFGQSYSEAMAEMLSSKVLGQDIQSAYRTMIYHYATLLKATNTTLGDAITYGYDRLLYNMEKVGITNPMQYIYYADNTLTQIKEAPHEYVDYELQTADMNWLTEWFNSMISEDISKEDMKKRMSEALNNYRNYIEPEEDQSLSTFVCVENDNGYISAFDVGTLEKMMEEPIDLYFDTKIR